MAALTGNRSTPARDGKTFAIAAAAGVHAFAGALIALNAAGEATPGETALNLTGFGRAVREVDNTNGASGAAKVEIEKGCFRFENSTAADAISAAEIGETAFIVDDQTVAKTDGGGTRSPAGVIADVDSAGVWISFS